MHSNDTPGNTKAAVTGSYKWEVRGRRKLINLPAIKQAMNTANSRSGSPLGRKSGMAGYFASSAKKGRARNRMYAFKHTQEYKNARARKHTHKHTNTRTQTRTRIHIHTHTQNKIKHTKTHTITHTHAHTHTHISHKINIRRPNVFRSHFPKCLNIPRYILNATGCSV